MRACSYGEAQYLLSEGGVRTKPGQFLGRVVGLLPPKMVLQASGVEEAGMIPDLLDQIMANGQAIKMSLYSFIPQAARWSPETKAKVKSIYDRMALATPEEFRNAVEREAPEAADGIGPLKEVFDRIWMQYVEDGALSPKQRFTNYLPKYRERLAAKATGELHLEARGGYRPVPLEDMVRPPRIWSVKKRGAYDPSEVLHGYTFDDVLDIYFGQYGRHVAFRQSKPELERLLKSVPDDYKQYAADVVNYWLGMPEATSGLSHALRGAAAGMRQYQFLRTIGGSVLSPLINSLQKINTYAVVGHKAFMQAFDDMHDPNRLRYAIQAGISPGLEKVGAEPIGPPSALHNKISKLFGHWFTESERNNRIHSFLAGMREAEARDVNNLQEQIKFGRKVMNETQFITGPANQPPLLRSEIGKTLGQFQSFRMNQTHFMLRLTDEAIEGIKTGDLERTIPFLKFWGPTIALGGLTFSPLGLFMDDRQIREAVGGGQWAKAGAGGIPELLLGVTLGHQMGLGAVGAEDMQSFLFYIPGPSMGFFQSLVGASLGVSAGRGLEGLFSPSAIGRKLAFEERVRLAAQSLPAGLQLSRAMQFVKLLENNGEYKAALDWPTVLGVAPLFGQEPETGDLLSGTTAGPLEVLGALAGFPGAERQQEREALSKQKEMESDYKAMANEAAEYYAAGNVEQAYKIIGRFNKKYERELEGGEIPWISPASIKAAIKRRYLPPGERVKPPSLLRYSEPYQEIEE